ncbi:MAG: diaminopimelate decarboxylase [Phycisphaerales bacterium]
MDHFRYEHGELHCESLKMGDLAARIGTPAYVYSRATLETHYDRLAQAFGELDPLICFSTKCCSNLHVLRTLAQRGSGLDVVSGGELHRARLAGVPPEKIVFAGVGKTDDEIRDALGKGRAAPGAPGASQPIGLFNIESEGEFEVIASAARGMGVEARAALRVNPDVQAGGHAYISTGHKESKFGVDLQHARTLFEKFGKEKHLRLCGVHMHIGSSITQTQPYVESVGRILTLVDDLNRRGTRIEVLDLGGGFGADYKTGASPPAAEFAKAIAPLLRDRVRAGLKIILEPGRTIAGNAGVLLTRVLYVKYSGRKKFIVCDAGMNTLIRPALYGSFHFIWPISVSPQHEPARRAEVLDVPGLEPADVVGPVCESGDFLAQDRPLPPVARGDLLAVFTAGAYGMTMASRYNSHPLPCEVLVSGSRAQVIRERETLSDLIGTELEARDVAV